jgi:hypothetical protein
MISTFTVTASPVNPKASTVVHFALSGTAVRSKNYQISANLFTIPAGASTATIRLTVLSATIGARTATATLTAGTGYTISAQKTATVSISR